MKWEDNRRSDNVEDRRSSGGGLGGGMGLGGRGIGIGTIIIVVIASFLFGINPLTLLGILGGGGGMPDVTVNEPAQTTRPPADDTMGQFVATVLADTEDVWGQMFRSANGQYREPKLVLFRGATRSACGVGQAAMGPFYCPADEKVYIDLSFYDLLKNRMGAPGDFAQAYVIAHEVGHHVQNLMGITQKVDGMRGRVSEAQMNALSVRVELQADCFAGVWAHHAHKARQIIEQGDIEEAMNAAAQIGDDALQRRQQGYVVPDSFTHGSSAQRQTWFRRGLQGGRVADCNTFDTPNI
jgi:predicted metalloprotease